MDVLDLRHELHRHPELSGHESDTAWRIREFFRAVGPDEVHEHLAGAGLAFVFEGAEPGPTILLRCELDALRVAEPSGAAWRSIHPGVSHACGHDGHMAILAEVGRRLGERRPARGRVVLLYQPAEETGQGARAVVDDPVFAQLRPDLAYALHNLPGYPLGEVLVREGSFSCASRGMTIALAGATAHAAQPETGRSPARATARIIEALHEPPASIAPADELCFVTVVGAQLGDRAFGVAPGRAELWATLRSETDETMERLVAHVESMARAEAARDDLEVTFAYEDVYPALVNHGEAVDRIRRAAAPLPLREMEQPFRWSEDFGHITQTATGALFGIGSGTEIPDLHNADYAFPDALVPIAADLFSRLIGLADG